MNRQPIHYKVQFPVWENIPPKITKISVNGNLICSGPRIPSMFFTFLPFKGRLKNFFLVQSVPVWTKINLQHKLRLDILPLLSSLDSTTEDSTSQFNNVDNGSLTGNFKDLIKKNLIAANQFDVRSDNYPSGSNNVFTDFGPNRPPPPPPDRRPPPNNPFFNGKNPYGFNPPGPPPRRPPPDQGPKRNVVINPQNPFFTGLSTPQPPRDEGDGKILTWW